MLNLKSLTRFLLLANIICTTTHATGFRSVSEGQKAPALAYVTESLGEIAEGFINEEEERIRFIEHFEIDPTSNRVVGLRGRHVNRPFEFQDPDAAELKHKMVVHLFNRVLYVVWHGPTKDDLSTQEYQFELNSAEFSVIQTLPVQVALLDKQAMLVPESNVWYSTQRLAIGYQPQVTLRFQTWEQRRLKGFLPVRITFTERADLTNPDLIKPIRELQDELRRLSSHISEGSNNFENKQLISGQEYNIRTQTGTLTKRYLTTRAKNLVRSIKDGAHLVCFCHQHDLAEITQELYRLSTNESEFIFHLKLIKPDPLLGLEDIFAITLQSKPINMATFPIHSYSIDVATINTSLPIVYQGLIERANLIGALYIPWSIIIEEDRFHIYSLSKLLPGINLAIPVQDINGLDRLFDLGCIQMHYIWLKHSPNNIAYSSASCGHIPFEDVDKVFKALNAAKICKNRGHYIMTDVRPQEIDGKYFIDCTEVTLDNPFRLIHRNGRVEYYFKRAPLGTAPAARAPAPLPAVGGGAAAAALEVLTLRHNRTEPYIIPLDLPLGVHLQDNSCGNGWYTCSVRIDKSKIIPGVNEVQDFQIVRYNGRYNPQYSTIFTSLTETVYTNITRINRPVTLDNEDMSKEDFVKHLNNLLTCNALAQDIFPNPREYLNPIVQVIVRKGSEVTNREVFLVIRRHEADIPIAFKVLPRSGVEPVEVEYIG